MMYIPGTLHRAFDNNLAIQWIADNALWLQIHMLLIAGRQRLFKDMLSLSKAPAHITFIDPVAIEFIVLAMDGTIGEFL